MNKETFGNLPLPRYGEEKIEIYSTPLGTRYIPLTDWPNHHPWPKLGGLRHLVFYSQINGFDRVIRRSGRRILLDEMAFFQWLNFKNEKQGDAK